MKGVPFPTYLYMPEINPITNEIFCDREDEADVLKLYSFNICLLFYTENCQSHLLRWT